MGNALIECRVTLGIIAVALVAFLIFGAGPLETNPQSSVAQMIEAFLNIFRHGNGVHLFGNVLIIFWGGTHIEPKYGSEATFGLLLGAIAIGTGLQVLLVDGNFLGLSGVAYCFAICSLMLHSSIRWGILILFSALILVGTEARFMAGTIAEFAHLGGILTGGGWSMFQKLFGQKQSEPKDPEQPFLAPLLTEQIERIVEIIDETDDDDAADADETLRARGCDGMYALWHQNRIIGVTGYAPSEAGDDVVWLSWTYLESKAKGRALGRFMVEELLRILNKQKVRKVFIATSDYQEDGKDVYADARKFYEALGAKLEITIPAFYSPVESKLIYGLENPGVGKAESLEDLGDRGASFTGIELDEDSDDIGAIVWEEAELGITGIDMVLGLANSRNFRQSLVALPADISDMSAKELASKSFERIGMLEDYYALNLGQVWWRIY